MTRAMIVVSTGHLQLWAYNTTRDLLALCLEAFVHSRVVSGANPHLVSISPTVSNEPRLSSSSAVTVSN